MSKLPIAELVSAIDSPNGWRRDTAQRLLVERKDPESLAPLRALLTKSARPASRATALATLEMLGGLEDPQLATGLNDPNPRVREVAVRLAEPRMATNTVLPQRFQRLARDGDAGVRLQVALSAGAMEPVSRAELLAELAVQSEVDELQSLAIRSSLGDRPWPVLEQVLWTDRLSTDPTPERLAFLRALALDTGGAGPDQDRASLVSMLANLGGRGLVVRHLALFDGLAAGWAVADPGWHDRLSPLLQREERRKWFNDLVGFAATTAAATNQLEAARHLGLSVLARTGTPEASGALKGFLKAPHSEGIQAAAARAIADSREPALYHDALQGWKTYGVNTRRALLGGSLRSAENALVLLDGIDQGLIAPTEVDPATQQGLREHRLAGLADRVQRTLGPKVSADRQQVVDSFQPALTLSGDARKGGVLFSRTCMTCHRIGDRGQAVGPDLSGVGGRPKESLLVDILDPSRQVPGDFVNYTLVTTSGDTLSGLLVSDSPGGVTLRRPGMPDEFVARNRVVELQASGRSLMPDGLESGWKPQDVADLLEFLKNPSPDLLSPGG
jgi:putative heme-binding domain-containing protein